MAKARRRQRGDGSVFYDAARETWVARLPIGGGKRLSAYAASEQLARAALRELVKKAGAPAVAAPTATTVTEYLRSWLLIRRQAGLKIKTDEFYTRGVEQLLVPVLGTTLLRDLDAVKILGLYTAMQTAGRSTAALGQAHATLSSALTYAVQVLRLVATNPIAGVKKPAATKAPENWWSAAELLAFEAASRDDWYGPLYSLALRTGARQGELLALHWDAVDLKAGTLRIDYTLTESKGVIRGRYEVKSLRSRRTVTLDAESVAALRRQRANLLSTGLTAAPAVFQTQAGEYVHKSLLTVRFNAAIARAGVKRIKFHGCRHTHASMLLAAGENPRAVADRLGHDVALLLKTYAHVSIDDQRRLTARFSEALGGALTSPPVQ